MQVTQIAGVEIGRLAEEFGTPTYVYDQEMIERRIADLAGFETIRFAQKANSSLAVLSIMRRHGVLVDAVSVGEMSRAIRVGYRPDQIVYTSDIFSRDSLEFVVQHRIPVNCGSIDMIAQLGQRSPGRSVTLRINPGFGHGHSQKTNTGGEQSKHGIWHQALPQCVEVAKSNNVTIAGIHMHIGSGSDFEHLSQVGGALEVAAKTVGNSLTAISAGGGLPTPYRPGDQPIDIQRFTRLWLDVQKRLEATLGRKIHLEVEPGRYLVAEAGYLITEIRAVKSQGNNTFYLLDAGFNNLARPILYGAYHPMSICPVGHQPIGTQKVVVGGPLCESGDIFTQAEGGFVETRELPTARVGDFLTIHCAGAYSFVMGSNYNSMPLAAEVIIRDRQPILVRRRQTSEDLMAGEIIPV